MSICIVLYFIQNNQNFFCTCIHPAMSRTMKAFIRLLNQHEIPAGCLCATWFVHLTACLMIIPLSCKDQAQGYIRHVLYVPHLARALLGMLLSATCEHPKKKSANKAKGKRCSCTHKLIKTCYDPFGLQLYHQVVVKKI